MAGEADVKRIASIAAGLPLGSAIVVATDGTHDSDGAVRVGSELSRHHGIATALISVVEAIDFVEYDGCSPADVERAARLIVASREGELAAQRRRTGTFDDAPPCEICVGCRVDEIVRFAERHNAALIVMGVGSQGVLARLLNRHTVSRLIATTTIPVLAVSSDGLSLADSRMYWLSAQATSATPIR